MSKWTVDDRIREIKAGKKSYYPSHYKTALVLCSNKIYSVVGQSHETKEASTFLLLDVDGFKRWFSLAQLQPCL